MIYNLSLRSLQNLHAWSVATLPTNNHIEEVALSISSKQNKFYLHESLHNLSAKEQIKLSVQRQPSVGLSHTLTVSELRTTTTKLDCSTWQYNLAILIALLVVKLSPQILKIVNFMHYFV